LPLKLYFVSKITPSLWKKTTLLVVEKIFSHPDYNCRLRNYTLSKQNALADCTAGGDLHSAPKNFYLFLGFVSIND